MVRCISIFSGAGGLDIGAAKAGANIAAFIDNDSDSIATLKLNHISEDSSILEKDICEVDFRFWRSRQPTILIGGPPCQPFSKNGYWVRNDNRLIEEDPRNLLAQFLRAVRELEPSGFLFENVESIRHPSNLDTFNRFLLAATRLGYSCTDFRANSADFGVPQKRKRIIVFGVRGLKSAIPLPCPSHADPKQPDLLNGYEPYAGVGQYIEKFASQNYTEPQEDPSGGNYYYELVNVPPGKNYIALSKLKDFEGRTFRSGSRFWNFLQKLHPDEPSITIAAQPGPWVGPFHWENRRLRVPEIAAIQTFPEDYEFAGNRRSIQMQIGNAVPCLLAEKMVAHLIEHLE